MAANWLRIDCRYKEESFFILMPSSAILVNRIHRQSVSWKELREQVWAFPLSPIHEQPAKEQAYKSRIATYFFNRATIAPKEPGQDFQLRFALPHPPILPLDVSTLARRRVPACMSCSRKKKEIKLAPAWLLDIIRLHAPAGRLWCVCNKYRQCLFKLR